MMTTLFRGTVSNKPSLQTLTLSLKVCCHGLPWHRSQLVFNFFFVDLFPENQMPWLLDMLQNDVFGGADHVSKSHFYQVRSRWNPPSY